MAIAAFMSIRLPPRHQPANGFMIEQLGRRRNFCHGAIVDADIGDHQLAAASDPRINYLAQFWQCQSHRHFRLNRNTERPTAVGIQAGRNIHRDDRQTRRIKKRDGFGEPAAHFALESGTEDGVDDQSIFGDAPAEQLKIFAGDFMNFTFEPEKRAQIMRRVARQLVLARQQCDFAGNPLFLEQARDHETITAIVAFSGNNQDALLCRAPKAPNNRFCDSGAGALH